MGGKPNRSIRVERERETRISAPAAAAAAVVVVFAAPSKEMRHARTPRTTVGGRPADVAVLLFQAERPAEDGREKVGCAAAAG